MNPEELARELYESSDDDFAEAMVMLYKMQQGDETLVTKEDMNNFNIGEFTQWLGICLNEIIFSEEMNQRAWWKR